MAEKQKGMDETELLSMLEDHFQAAEDATVDARRESERCRDYYDNKQWTAEEVAKLEERNQPVITDNMIKDKVDWLLGMERRARTDPKAYPRNPDDEESAEAATDALRYIADDCDFDQTKSSAAEDFFIEGSGFCEIIIKRNVENAVREGMGRPPRVIMRPIRWDRMYYDPHSRKHDFTDAEYMGQVVWMDVEKAKRKWPDSAELFESNFLEGQREMSETYSDKPISRWVDPKRKRVRIAEEYYKKDGTVYRCLFTRGGLIEKPEETVYVDDEGEKVWPYEGISAYVDRDGNRYGVVQRYLDPQDEVNKRRSKSLHLLSTNHITAEKGAVDDVVKARKEASKPDGYNEVNPNMRFDIERNVDLANGQFQLLVDAKQTLASQGPNEALVQGGGASESGRSRQIRQETSTIQLGPLFDRLRHFQRRCFRKAWGCVRQFWTEEAWIRVTDDEKKLRFVPLNQPITKADQIAQELEKARSYQPQNEQEAAELQAVINDLTMALQDPRANEVVGTRNAVSELDMDIILDESADTITLQAEQFEMLTNLASSGIPIPPEVILEASSLRNKDRLIEMLKASSESQGQMQQLMQEMEMRRAEIEDAKTQSETVLNQARAEKEQMEALRAQVEAMLAQISPAPPVETKVSV